MREHFIICWLQVLLVVLFIVLFLFFLISSKHFRMVSKNYPLYIWKKKTWLPVDVNISHILFPYMRNGTTSAVKATEVFQEKKDDSEN